MSIEKINDKLLERVSGGSYTVKLCYYEDPVVYLEASGGVPIKQYLTCLSKCSKKFESLHREHSAYDQAAYEQAAYDQAKVMLEVLEEEGIDLANVSFNASFVKLCKEKNLGNFGK